MRSADEEQTFVFSCFHLPRGSPIALGTGPLLRPSVIRASPWTLGAGETVRHVFERPGSSRCSLCYPRHFPENALCSDTAGRCQAGPLSPLGYGGVVMLLLGMRHTGLPDPSPSVWGVEGSIDFGNDNRKTELL